MCNSTLWACIVLIVSAGILRAAEVGPQVFDGKIPDDRRLQRFNDVDHPVVFQPSFKDKAAWENRRKQLREQVLVAEGLWPMPPRTPLNAVIHGKIERDGYTIEKVFFASYPGHYVSGNLYRPKNKSGKLPAVLSPHGHWNNGRMYENSDDAAEKQVQIGAEQTMDGAKYPLQARCAMLARMGCVVFHYDMVGYADSTQIEHRAGFTDPEAILRLQSFMGLQTWNSIRALDFLCGLEDVDANRIAVTGASGGGTQTFTLCAVDDRPAVAFPAVMVSEDMQGGCICENAPLLRVGTNNVELAAIFAPKPLGMSAADDWTRAMEVDALPKLQSIYGLFGAKNLVMGKHFSFEHNYNQVSRELMYNWFNDHLKLGLRSPVKERPFEPVPPRELSVYDDQHPRPSDACDAATLRKYMTESSDAQLEQLAASNPGEYRRIVRTALRVMVHDRMPGVAEVVSGRSSGPALDNGIIMETGALSRRSAGEAVPYVSLIPKDWNGTVVVWVHPDGKSSLFGDDGKPSEAVRKLLEAKDAVLSADLFVTGEFVPAGEPARKLGAAQYERQNYAGFFFGYNRGVLANRVHDLLTAISFARHWKGANSIEVLALGKSGPVALLAQALGDGASRCAIDLAGFDFDQVTDADDPMMIPGALKYGGVAGLAAACNTGQTLLANARAPDKIKRAINGEHVTLREEPAQAQDLLGWLTGP